MKLEDYGTGWFGLQIALKTDEVDRLIESLNWLRKNKTEHFHFHSKFLENDKSGIGDVEISIMGLDEQDNAGIG